MACNLSQGAISKSSVVLFEYVPQKGEKNIIAMNEIDENEIHDNDVRCGRGHGSNRHPGNIDYRQIVHERKERYINEKTYFGKSVIAKEILSIIKAKNPPGRFVEQHPKSENWEVISDEKAERKIKQALREGERGRASSARRRRSGNNTARTSSEGGPSPKESSSSSSNNTTSRSPSPPNSSATAVASAVARKRALETELYNIVQPQRNTSFNNSEESTRLNDNLNSFTYLDGSRKDNSQASTSHQQHQDERFVSSTIDPTEMYPTSVSSLKQSMDAPGDHTHGWNTKGQAHRYAELFSTTQHALSDPRSLYYKDHALNRNVTHDYSRSFDIEHQYHDSEKDTSMSISEEIPDSQKKSNASIMNASIMSVGSDISLTPGDLAAPDYSPLKMNKNQGEALGYSQISDIKQIPDNIMMVDSANAQLSFGDSLLSLGEGDSWFPNAPADTTTSRSDLQASEREHVEYLDDSPKEDSSNVEENRFLGQSSTEDDQFIYDRDKGKS